MTSPAKIDPAAATASPPRSWRAIIVWLLLVVLAVGLILRASFTADLSAFLPRNPTQQQQLLVEQLRDGMVSRLILVAIEDSDTTTRATLSRAMATNLRKNQAFISINNGEPVNQAKDQAYLFNNRYLLSPAVNAKHFSAAGLHTALNDTLDMLASPAGLLIKDALPQDPTGEMANMLMQFNGKQQPRKINGVWASKDGKRALLLAQTRALGSDTDGQELAIAQIKRAFEEARSTIASGSPAAATAKLLMTGPGVFGVNARNTITTEALQFSILSATLIMAMLFFVYRSGIAVFLGLMPVISGILAGTVAVSLGFGTVHGITLGFGTTLIGEAIDYSIYLFIQSGNAAHSKDWAKTSWPTIQLGVLTSMAGFGCLLFSGFPGLAQLGLFTIAGLIAAAFVTRFVLPSLLPRNFAIRDLSHIGLRVQGALLFLQNLRKAVFVIVLFACAALWLNRTDLWQPELSALSPISKQDQNLDAALRKDVGAPDVRYLIVVKGKTEEDVLQASEKVSAQLTPLIAQHQLAAFESPSRYLPSLATQRQRLASLPDAAELQQRINQAAQDLPFKTELLTPFVHAVGSLAALNSDPAQREARLLTREDLQGTSMALATDSLLIHQKDSVSGLIPLTAASEDGLDADLIRTALANASVPQAYFIDLKAETNKLYRGYMHEAVMLALSGMAAMIVLLAFNLRSWSALLRVMTPLISAVLCVAAILAVSGQRMTILHLIGLLLIVAVGSNYALFFARAERQIEPTTLASLIFANVTTVIGFGVLGFSSVPVLNAIGVTVGMGVVLALTFSAIFSHHDSVARRKL